jgi:hypothetical protein
MEIDAMHVVVGKAVLGHDDVTERARRQQGPVLPPPHVAGGGAYGNCVEGVTEAQSVQDAVAFGLSWMPAPISCSSSLRS